MDIMVGEEVIFWHTSYLFVLLSLLSYMPRI